MPTEVRKTPSYLKGLAENRARADGEVIRLQRLLDDLARAVAEARRILSLHESVLAQQAEAIAKRDACDTLICSFDSRLDPSQIAPIHAFKGRYGPRGGLRAAILEILQDAAPDYASTTEISMQVMTRLKLSFPTPAEKSRWVTNSLLCALKDLAEDGLTERLHDPAAGSNAVGRWRLKSAPDGALAELSAAAESAGLGVHQAKRRGRRSKAAELAS